MRVSLPRKSRLPRPVVQQRHETALSLIPSQQHVPASCVHEYPEVGVFNRVALDHHVLRRSIAVRTHAHLDLRIVVEVIVAQDGAKVQARQGAFHAQARRIDQGVGEAVAVALADLVAEKLEIEVGLHSSGVGETVRAVPIGSPTAVIGHDVFGGRAVELDGDAGVAGLVVVEDVTPVRHGNGDPRGLVQRNVERPI